MSEFRLHATYLRDETIAVWIEDVAGKRVVSAENFLNVELDPLSDQLRSAAVAQTGRTTYHAVPIWLMTPKGKFKQLNIPAVVVPPAHFSLLFSLLPPDFGLPNSGQPVAENSAVPPADQNLAEEPNAHTNLGAGSREGADLAADFRWLAQLWWGLAALAAAGRVTVRTRTIDGVAYPGWRLLVAPGETAFLSQMDEAAPGSVVMNFHGRGLKLVDQPAPGQDTADPEIDYEFELTRPVAEEICERIFHRVMHWLINGNVNGNVNGNARAGAKNSSVTAESAANRVLDGLHLQHPLIAALQSNLALPGRSAQFQYDMIDWQRTLVANSLTGVLRLVEPQVVLGDDLEDVVLADSVEPASKHWKLELLIRTQDGRLNAPSAFPEHLDFVITELQRLLKALRAYKLFRGAMSTKDYTDAYRALLNGYNDAGLAEPSIQNLMLQKRLNDAQRLSPGIDLRADGEFFTKPRTQPGERSSRQLEARREFLEKLGDLKISLIDSSVIEFLGSIAPRLVAKGVQILIPRSLMESDLKLVAHAKSSGLEVQKKSNLGEAALLEFQWQMYTGVGELTPEEQRALLNSAHELVQIRGQWLHVNEKDLARARDYVSNMAKNHASKIKEDIESLLQIYPGLTVDDPLRPDAASQLAALQQQLKDLERNALSIGEVSERELRELAIEHPELPAAYVGEDWRLRFLRGERMTEPHPVEVPTTVHATLHEYQKRGVDWMNWMVEHGLGFILADDMGLGKTLQLLTLIALQPEEPVVVVCPASVMKAWQDQSKQFTPSFEVLVHHGTNRLTGQDFVDAAQSARLVVTTFSTLTRDIQDFIQVQWNLVIADEAQHVKNSQTKAAKALQALPSKVRIAATGTPVENRLGELYTLLNFCNPGMLGRPDQFRTQFAAPIEREESELHAQRLRELTAPFMLRRLKTDPAVGLELPERDDVIVEVDLTAAQASLYQAEIQHLAERLAEVTPNQKRMVVLGALTRTKLICDDPGLYLKDGSGLKDEHGRYRSAKITAMMDILTHALSRGERVLVFSQYVEYARRLVDEINLVFGPSWNLDAEATSANTAGQGASANPSGQETPAAVLFSGSLSPKARSAMIDNFQSGTGPQVMVISLKAGGVGITLTEANVVIHMDRWWNPAVENQATDRAHRIGQTRDVRVYKMVARGTIEERINDVIEQKMALAENTISVGENWLSTLPDDQVEQLFAYQEYGEWAHNDPDHVAGFSEVVQAKVDAARVSAAKLKELLASIPDAPVVRFPADSVGDDAAAAERPRILSLESADVVGAVSEDVGDAVPDDAAFDAEVGTGDVASGGAGDDTAVEPAPAKKSVAKKAPAKKTAAKKAAAKKAPAKKTAAKKSTAKKAPAKKSAAKKTAAKKATAKKTAAKKTPVKRASTSAADRTGSGKGSGEDA